MMISKSGQLAPSLPSLVGSNAPQLGLPLQTLPHPRSTPTRVPVDSVSSEMWLLLFKSQPFFWLVIWDTFLTPCPSLLIHNIEGNSQFTWKDEIKGLTYQTQCWEQCILVTFNLRCFHRSWSLQAQANYDPVQATVTLCLFLSPLTSLSPTNKHR